MPCKSCLPAILLLAIVSVVVLSACSSSENEKTSSEGEVRAVASATASSRAFNSCDLLTKADINKLFPGVTVRITGQGDKAKEAIGIRICFYDLSPNDMKFIQTSLSRTSDLTPELVKAGRTAGKMYYINKGLIKNPVSVSGMGKEACYGGSGLNAFAGLHILIDQDTVLTVNVGLGTGNADKTAHIEKEKAIAHMVITRLAEMQ